MHSKQYKLIKFNIFIYFIVLFMIAYVVSMINYYGILHNVAQNINLIVIICMGLLIYVVPIKYRTEYKNIVVNKYANAIAILCNNEIYVVPSIKHKLYKNISYNGKLSVNVNYGLCGNKLSQNNVYKDIEINEL